MKKYMLLYLLLPCLVEAQNREIIETASGEDLTKKVSTHMQYLLPEFTNGEVYYLGIPKGTGRMNYNMLLGEMQFLQNGKVFALDNVQDVIVVNIDNRKFYPFNDKEFAEELLTTGKVQLRLRRKGNTVQHSKKGAYGTSSSTSAITSYSSINSNSRQYDLAVEENVMITLNFFYYLVGTNGKYTLIKNQKAFTKLFTEHKAPIEAFVKEHNTRFDNENDLKTLLEYCIKL